MFYLKSFCRQNIISKVIEQKICNRHNKKLLWKVIIKCLKMCLRPHSAEWLNEKRFTNKSMLKKNAIVLIKTINQNGFKVFLIMYSLHQQNNY